MTVLELQRAIIPEIGLSTENTVASLQYAKIIQDALLCNRTGLYKIFGEYSLIYKPKNILSGDFYFYKHEHGKVYLAVCDCTGHGISGALLSILGHNMLARSIKKYKSTSSILTYLNQKIKESFNVDTNLTNMGLDITLMAIDQDKNEVEYSGAGQSLFLSTAEGVKRYRGNRKSIGCCTNCVWTSELIRYKTGDKFYLTSDGLPDQFGEESGKKFSYQRLMDFLSVNRNLEQQEIESLLSAFLEDYQGQEVQTDDMLFLGVTL